MRKSERLAAVDGDPRHPRKYRFDSARPTNPPHLRAEALAKEYNIRSVACHRPFVTPAKFNNYKQAVVFGNFLPYLPYLIKNYPQRIVLSQEHDQSPWGLYQEFRPNHMMIFEADYPHEYLLNIPTKVVLVNCTPCRHLDSVNSNSRKVASYLLTELWVEKFLHPLNIEVQFEKGEDSP